MKLSVVMPVYNEERTLREIVGRVLAQPYEIELVLVNDCSRDGTAKIMGELAAAHQNVRCFHHERNQGKGGALATGFKQVTGDVVVIQDADLEYDPADYKVLLRPILEGRADVVFGSRFLGGPYMRVHMRLNVWLIHFEKNLLVFSMPDDARQFLAKNHKAFYWLKN